MNTRRETSKVVDLVIKIGCTSTYITAGFVAPNLLQVLDKPMRNLYASLDKRARDREAMRIIRNMKAQGYLTGDYEHSLRLTPKAKKRYERIVLDSLTITQPEIWDKKWRIIMYDIPQKQATSRQAFGRKLREIGCHQLQKSVWITPFPCLETIEAISAHYDIADNVSYFDTSSINNQSIVVDRFNKQYPDTMF